MSKHICPSAPILNSVLHPGFCAIELPIAVDQPRGVVSMDDGDDRLLVLERGSSSVVLLEDLDGDSVPESKRILASTSGLNQGLAVHDGFLYASSDSTVYRWPLSNGLEEEIVEDPTVVINNINDDGRGGTAVGHRTRTLAFDEQGMLYVSVGSVGNADPDSFRSRVRRFSLDDESLFPLDFTTGEVFADGLRNEVGLAFDKHGVLWGVENGGDNLVRDDLGGDIHNDNPAEELNQFTEPGLHYGYPFCWTEYKLPDGVGLGRGASWAWPGTFDEKYTDEMCRELFVPPALSMPAHMAPLGITFYQWRPEEELPEGCTGAFPIEMDGFAFIAFHGSFNRDVPIGYKVSFVVMDEEGNVASDLIDLLAHTPPNAKWESGFRPVDVEFDRCGRLIVTSDGTRSSGSYIGSSIVRIANLGTTTFNFTSNAPTGQAEVPSSAFVDDRQDDTDSLGVPVKVLGSDARPATLWLWSVHLTLTIAATLLLLSL